MTKIAVRPLSGKGGSGCMPMPRNVISNILGIKFSSLDEYLLTKATKFNMEK